MLKKFERWRPPDDDFLRAVSEITPRCCRMIVHLCPFPMKLSAVASALDVRLENGSSDTEIDGLNGIEQAGAGELTFVSNPKYAAAARTTKASAVIVSEDFPAIPE